MLLAEHPTTLEVVGLERFELSTSRLSSARSNQLSYRPGKRGGRPSEERETKAAVSRKRGFGEPHVFLSSEIEPETLPSLACGPVSDFRILRKEVIQPQVPLRLPCYDLVTIAEFIFGAWFLAVTLATSDTPHFRGLTGGVYKAQEHIHRGMLTRDY